MQVLSHTGSSPLTRGTLAGCGFVAAAAGLIPAHAGNTPQISRVAQFMRAHPRSRGEHGEGRSLLGFGWGSSPLTRGTLCLISRQKNERGLIPAHAGNTNGGHGFVLVGQAHPRSRGEHTVRRGTARCRLGSSPLTRGTLHAQTTLALLGGLIPAHAGNTLADMGFYPLHQQNRITLKPEPTSRIHDK